MIAIEQYRAAVGLFVSFCVCKKLKMISKLLNLLHIMSISCNIPFYSFCFLCLTVQAQQLPWYVIQLLLLRSGIHPNPGPVNKFLSICHCNVQSLYMRSNTTDSCYKLDDIHSILCIDKGFDIICLTETWLTGDIDVDKLNINGYSLLRRDSWERRGGVAIYYNDDLICTELATLNTAGSECMWMSVKIGSKNVFVSVYYRPPNQSIQ